MLVEIRVPKLGSAGWSYTKMTCRAQDWATVAVAAVVHGNGRIERATVFTNMGATTIHARATEQALEGGARSRTPRPSPPREQSRPGLRRDSDFRRHLARVLTAPRSRRRERC